MTSTASRPKKGNSSKPAKRRPSPRLDRETPLLPRIVAECICAEAAAWLDDDRPMTLAPALAARATQIYARNPTFARRLRAPGNVGREWLRVFLRHWLSARLARQHPALFHRLPSSFCVGWPLPSKRPPPAASLDRQIAELTSDRHGLTTEERELIAGS